jgi:ABC-type Fe3+ transport system permease subunit
MLVFARTMVDYVVIDTIGGFRYATLAVEIYNLNFGFLEQELAAPLAVLLAIITMGIMYSYLYLFRWRSS